MFFCALVLLFRLVFVLIRVCLRNLPNCSLKIENAALFMILSRAIHWMKKVWFAFLFSLLLSLSPFVTRDHSWPAWCFSIVLTKSKFYIFHYGWNQPHSSAGHGRIHHARSVAIAVFANTTRIIVSMYAKIRKPSPGFLFKLLCKRPAILACCTSTSQRLLHKATVK